MSELERLIERHARGRGLPTIIPRQFLVFEDESPSDVDLAYRPMLCFVVRGAKVATTGTRTTRVGAGQMFLSLLRVPVVATFESPYRSVTLDIDDEILGNVIAAQDLSHDESPAASDGFVSVLMGDGVLGAVTRWVGLLDEPELVDTLSLHLEREILMRVLRGPLGPGLRATAVGGPLDAVRRAAATLTRNAADFIDIRGLAGDVGMSPATFYRWFREGTGMSPLQFQKATRLQNGRRLMVRGGSTVAAVAREVGYLSAEQFSRDYRRRYGAPPARDGRGMRLGLHTDGASVR